MGSIFDNITVPGAGITPGSHAVPRYSSGSNRSGGPMAASVGSTHLVATVEPEEFLRLAADAGQAVALYLEFQSPPVPLGNRPIAAKAGHRYTLSVAGIVFVTVSDKALDFPGSVRVVKCTGVLYDGKSIA